MGVDIPGFIRYLREGDATQALERIRKDNPFPAVCGRICPAPCEEACVFHADGVPIAIKNLERFAADAGQWKLEKRVPAQPRQKIAVIGSGPAGMAAAYYLAKAQMGVTVFEAAHAPGGLLRFAVPEFRLPQKVLDDQFALLAHMGVEVKTDVVFGRTMMIDELFMQGYAAVLLAVGASLPRFSELPGADLAGVYYDVEFLNRMQSVHKEDALKAAKQQGITGAKTVVVGRGRSAFDAARLSARLGSQVRLVFDGLEEQAGVHPGILKETRDEGIEILTLRVLEMVGDDAGCVTGVKCRALDLIEQAGGLKLEPSAQDPVVLEAETVIMANGCRPNGFLKQYLPQLKCDEDGLLSVDRETGMTSMDKVFACGSAAAAGNSVVEAFADGKAAAQKIIRTLG